MDTENFKKEFLRRIEVLNERIDELQKKLEPKAKEVKGDAKVMMEKSLVELHEIKTNLQESFSDMQKAAGKKWEETKVKYEPAYKEMQSKTSIQIEKIWERLKSFFE
ncbi:MAG: hypothetical protein QM654_06245 [Dysgonamonadaceae bacterium]